MCRTKLTLLHIGPKSTAHHYLRSLTTIYRKMQRVTLWATSTKPRFLYQINQIRNEDGTRDLNIKRSLADTYSVHRSDIIANVTWICGTIRRAFRSGHASSLACIYHLRKAKYSAVNPIPIYCLS